MRGIMDSTLIFISGSSGAGKNTIINAVIGKHGDTCQFLVSNTTREKRASDRKVGQYKYITKEEFEAKINNGEMLEYDIYNDNYYGLDSEEVIGNSKTGKVLLQDLTVLGVLKSREVLADKIKQVGVFVTERKKVLRERLINRGESKENIKNRLKVYKNEQKMSHHYDYLVVNSSVQKSVENLEAVINVEHNNMPILTNVSTQRISTRRIDKVVNRLKNGKIVDPIKVCENNGRVYIVEGVNTYLASLYTGINVTKEFVNRFEKINKDINQDEWLKIVDNYREC